MIDWISTAWACEGVAEAIAIASPDLAAQISRVVNGTTAPTPARGRRLAVSLARYLVRMRGRPTPFGMFAGVAALAFGPDVSVEHAPDAAWVRTRAHAAWLAKVIALLEADPDLRRRLPVTWNDLIVQRGDRLVVPWQPHGVDPARAPATEVSLRMTAPVRVVAGHAAAPITVADLASKVTADLPALPALAVEALLTRLIDTGVLISALRPPSTCRDGLAHLLEQLAEVGAGEISVLAPLLADLAAISADLQAGRRDPAKERMLQVAETPHPMTVDLRAGYRIRLPHAVAEEAAAALDALVRLTPHPGGVPGWREYQSKFLTRYGVGALVPVSALIDPVAGLGFPAHFAEPPGDLPVDLTRHDARLLRLAHQAALDGVREVVLDDAFIDGLHDGDPGGLRIPPHLEMCAQLWAPTTAALDAGDFRLVVSGVSRSGVALAGRFIDLLPEPDQEKRCSAYRGLPTGVDGAIAVQVSCPPIHAHLENVVRAPQLLDGLLTVAEHREAGDGRLDLSDLAVSADRHGMYLVSLSRRVLVEPVVANAGARHVMPPVVRLLTELPRARWAASSPFAWGAARCLPFLPRVVYGRTVLAAARWNLPVEELPCRGLTDARWRTEFARLRDRAGLPDTVSVGDSDLRLRLRLDDPMDLAVLRNHLDKARRADGTVMIVESSTPRDHGWFGGRAHEIILPVATTRSKPPPHLPADPLTVTPDRTVLPGGRILLAKLYTDPRLIDTILTAHLPALFADWPDPPGFWFVRYRDPDPHLRLRLHPEGRTGEAFERLSAWASGLRDQRLIRDLTFNTHHPETARYGDGPAQQAAEALFRADSAAVLAQLAALAAHRPAGSPLPLLAAGMTDLVAAMTDGRTQGMEWLVGNGDIGAAPAHGPGLVRRAVTLAGDPGEVEALPNGPQILSAWRARASAADAYRRHLAEDGPLRPLPVIRSLLHIHHIRACGIDPDHERAAYRLARAVALAWISRNRSVLC